MNSQMNSIERRVIARSVSVSLQAAWKRWNTALNRVGVEFEGKSSAQVIDLFEALGSAIRQNVDGDIVTQIAESWVSRIGKLESYPLQVEDAISEVTSRNEWAHMRSELTVSAYSEDQLQRITDWLLAFERTGRFAIGSSWFAQRVGMTSRPLQLLYMRIVADSFEVWRHRHVLAGATSDLAGWLATARPDAVEREPALQPTIEFEPECLASVTLGWMFALMKVRLREGLDVFADDADSTESAAETNPRSATGDALGPAAIDRVDALPMEAATSIASVTYRLAAAAQDGRASIVKTRFDSPTEKGEIELQFLGPDLHVGDEVLATVEVGSLPGGTRIAWRGIECRLDESGSGRFHITATSLRIADHVLGVQPPTHSLATFWIRRQ